MNWQKGRSAKTRADNQRSVWIWGAVTEFERCRKKLVMIEIRKRSRCWELHEWGTTEADTQWNESCSVVGIRWNSLDCREVIWRGERASGGSSDWIKTQHWHKVKGLTPPPKHHSGPLDKYHQHNVIQVWRLCTGDRPTVRFSTGTLGKINEFH